MDSETIVGVEQGSNGRGSVLFKSRKFQIALVVLVAVLGGVLGKLAMADNMTTATAKGIWLSIPEVKALPMSGPAWDNVKKVADGSLGTAKISDQTSNHDISTLAVALVYARTGDPAYRKKAADAVMSAVNTESGGRTLALSWNLSAYVISADLINLPQYDSAKNAEFRSWLSAVRTKTLDGKTLISTHEDRPNNWGTGAGASRVAADIYLNDRADLDQAAKVFRGWVGDRSAYSGFSYGDLSFQCNPSQPVGINPAGCKKGSVVVDGAIPDDMRRGGPFKDPPAPTHYPWTALQGAVAQAQMLSRQGYDAYGWSNQAIKRSLQYLYDLSKRGGGDWWANNAAAKWVPWVANSAYGSNYPTTSTESWGRVMNFADWTHAKRSNVPPPPVENDKEAPTVPSNLKTNTVLPKNVVLTWGPSTDNVTVSGYEIRRDGSVLGTTASLSFTDTKAEANKTYTYAVRAYDPSGNKSGNATLSVKVGAESTDKQPPTVSLTNPKANATISTSSVALTASANDNVGVTKVEFYVNGQLEATVEGGSGKTAFSANWNTGAAGNGTYNLEARAFDAAGNSTASQKINVTVKNTTSTPEPPVTGGGTVTFVAAADSRVSQKSPTKNYGGENYLRLRDYKSEDWMTYLKFNVTGLSAAPKKVTLRLFANDGGPSSGRVYIVSSAWTEKGIVWNNKPVLGSAFMIPSAKPKSVNDRSWVELDITNAVRGNGTFSFALVANDDNSVYYDSREAKNKPTLVIVK